MTRPSILLPSVICESAGSSKSLHSKSICALVGDSDTGGADAVSLVNGFVVNQEGLYRQLPVWWLERMLSVW